MSTIVLCDGKYEVTYIEGNFPKVKRHGVPWRDADLVGDNLVVALVEKILELESKRKEELRQAWDIGLTEGRETPTNNNFNPEDRLYREFGL